MAGEIFSTFPRLAWHMQDGKSKHNLASKEKKNHHKNTFKIVNISKPQKENCTHKHVHIHYKHTYNMYICTHTHTVLGTEVLGHSIKL